MSDISTVDKNFAVSSGIDGSETVFCDVTKTEAEIFGVIPPKNGRDKFRRMPKDVAEAVSDGVKVLHSNTAGGRIRFRTDSPFIAVRAELPTVVRFPHMPMTGSVGFDLYKAVGDEFAYVGTFVPPFDTKKGFTATVYGLEGECDYIINMPLYNDVSKVHIGVAKGAVISKSRSEYRKLSPVVYYGSSITQGGCASRPGNSYESIISRKLNCDYLNLGFSGSALAEREMTDYIKKLDMSVFVYDYDHNAPTADYLEKTHRRMFEEIRAENPTLPIVIVSRPKWPLDSGEKRRLEIIKKTYDFAVRNGDKNVFFIDGSEMMKEFCRAEGTVDNCHPNDFGFVGMAGKIGGVLEEILNNKRHV